MNVVLVDGFYDAQDLRLIQGVKDRLWYAKRRGSVNFPLPYIYTLEQWDINDDYEDFVNWTARRILFEHGDTVIVTPHWDQTFDLPTVQLKQPARLAQMVKLGMTVHL